MESVKSILHLDFRVFTTDYHMKELDIMPFTKVSV